MENEIIRKSTSITLIAIMVAGGLTFAIPGTAPSAHAQVNEMSVSAVNEMFGNSFAGAQVIEVAVNAPQFRSEVAGEAYEPVVTVDDNPLIMEQAGNGVWYGYFVESDMAMAAHEHGMDFGMVLSDMSFNNDAETLYGNDGTRNVLDNPDLPKSEIIIQAFDFTEGTDIDVELENGSESEAVSLTFDTVEDFASLVLDREVYPLEAYVHVTITDTWLNIDPTAEDEWVFNTDTNEAYYRPSENSILASYGDEITTIDEIKDALIPVPEDDLMCDDNCSFTINVAQQGDMVLYQEDNEDSFDDIASILGDMSLTFTETNDNTGVFTNTDDDDASNLMTTGDDELRGKTATIDYNDNDTDILIGFDFATVDIVPTDDTWNSGEEIAVIITDMDANKNSMSDEDLLVSDPNIDIIPALTTGSPVVITEDAEINGMSVEDMTYDSFSARVIVDGEYIGDTLTVTFDDDLDLPTESTVFNYINYDISSLGEADRVTMCGHVLPAGDQVYERVMAADVNGCDTVTFELADSADDDAMYPVVVDFMSFGYVDDGVQGSERIADQIIRIEAEETDDGTGVFEGSLEYIMVNQLNIMDQDTFDSVDPITDAAVFIVIEDLTDEDAPRVSYLDVGSDGVATQVSDQEEAPSHSGVVTFDSNRYKVADTVTITLDDADLNVDSGIIEVYTIDERTGFIGENDVVLLDVTFDDKAWVTPSDVETTPPSSDFLCRSLLNHMTDDTGLDATKFTLVESSKDSGVFTGSFQVPSDWCRPGDERPETTTGLDIEVNYQDFRDASGEMIEVGDSAAVGANTGSVALDRTVYPVPFGEPRDFSTLAELQMEENAASSLATSLENHEQLKVVIANAIEELLVPHELAADLSGDMRSLFADVRDNSDDWDDIMDNLDDAIDDVEDEIGEMRDLHDIEQERARAELDLREVEMEGVLPDGKSYFPVHSTGFGDVDEDAYIPNGDLTIHVRVTDADYDVSAAGQDEISSNGDGPVEIRVNRGSDSCILATAGSDSPGMRMDAEGCNGMYMRYGPIQEVAPDAGVFESDITVRYNNGPVDEKCPVRNEGCVLQGDIIEVIYADPIDASGDRNTVTDSATFDLRNAVLQSDKNQYVIGTDMILTLIEPDFDLDNDQAETYTLDLIEWDSDAATITMGDRGGQAGKFDPEPDAFRETGDSTGIFQTIIEIPDELEGDRLERNEVITLEYTDWGPAGADYVGDEDEDVTLEVMTSDFGATIELDQKVYTWTDKVYITIVAPDHNYDSDLVDEIGDEDTDPLKISTRGHDLDLYKLVETGTDTGIFTGEVILTGFSPHDADGDGEADDARDETSGSGPTSGLLETGNDDGLSVSYEYSEDITIVASALIRWNIGEVQWLESSYPATGTGVVRVIDPDMNLNPEAVDNFDINIWSDSDAGGIDLTITETNEATGIFEGTVAFQTETESSGHRLRAAEGDTVTAEYEDRTLPDPYNTVDDLDITATTLIGTVVPPLERAPASNLRVVDSFGNSLDTVSVDQQVQITADLRNDQDRNQAFAYLVQVQDANGVVVSLAWITGSLTPGQSFSPAESWTPDMAGTYTATAFVWESLDNPTALSPPVTTTITVE